MSGENIVFRAGRLKEFVSCWKEITSDPSILEIVSGCRINFEEHLYGSGSNFVLSFSNHEKEVIFGEIEKLLHMGAIEQVSEESVGFVSFIFTRPKKDGSVRTILNLKKLNENVQYTHFKMDTFEQAVTLVTQGCWMASIDLRNAYHTIPMHDDDKKYLQFRFDNKLYQYTCLPFGYSDAPRVFTKVLKPIFATLRERGHTVLGYLDDTFIVSNDEQFCETSVQQTSHLL